MAEPRGDRKLRDATYLDGIEVKPVYGPADVAGLEGVKHDLEEIVEFLKNPEKFQRLGGRVPKGVLLMGPPGTGRVERVNQ